MKQSQDVTLRDVRELLSDKDRWCQGEFARDANGQGLEFSSDEKACRWCLEGAMYKLGINGVYDEVLNKIIKSKYQIPPYFCPVVHLNDHLGHEAVIEVLDLAIAELENNVETRNPSPAFQ